MKDVHSKENWLANPDPERVADRLQTMHGRWAIWGTNPIVQAWVRNILAYYSAVLEPGTWDTSLVFEGKQGELVKMVVPQARSLIRQLITLTTKQKMAFQAIGQSETGDVVEQVRLGNSLIEQVLDKERCDQKGEVMAESAFITGQGFIGALWRTDRGGAYAVHPDHGSLIYRGEIEIVTPHILDIFFDYTVTDWERMPWVEIRVARNRWDLIAQFPELEDELLRVETVREGRGPYTWQDKIITEGDMIYCYELYIRPSPALPSGRMLFYASPKAIFSDGSNEYGTLPFEPMMPEKIMGMGLGYPALSNLLPAQEMLDHSFSAIATNQSAFAVQTITIPRGAGISVQQIEGMNFLSFTPMGNVQGGGRPEPLQMTQSSPETFKFIDLLKGHMLELSNLNAAMRGSPPPGVTSGTAIATLTTNALEFISSAQKAYTQTMERCMTHVLNAYQKFAKVPHNVTLYGKNNQAYQKEFTGDQLGTIDGVRVSVANPLMQTMSGRLELADKLAQQGLVKSTQDYLLILEGAPTRKLYETELSESDLMQSENDALQEGKEVPVLISDDHPAHIRKHSMLLNDPMTRLNGKSNKIITDHMAQHADFARQQDPFFAAMIRTGKMPEGGPPPPTPPDGVAPQGQPPPEPPHGRGGPNPAELPGQPTNQTANRAHDLLKRPEAGQIQTHPIQVG